LVPTGLIDSIYYAASTIDIGRKGWATKGKTEEGRISYEKGIAEAMTAFQEAQISADPQAMLLAEYTFLSQELEFCEKTDKHSLSSLNKAIQDFDDAFLVLEVVEDKTVYQGVEKSYPHDKKYRVSGFPKDSFHVACGGHKTRLQNILRTPGLDHIEKSLLKQRFTNLSAAQAGYIEKQKTALQN
jgi:hypothetical protein